MGLAQRKRQRQEAWHNFRRGPHNFLRRERSPIFDPDHSDEEDRFILLGVSHRLNTLVVATASRKMKSQFVSSLPEKQIKMKQMSTGVIGNERTLRFF